jgi:hypothetical protein
VRGPDAAIGLLRQRWRRHAGEWLAGGGTWPLRVPLQVPGERKAGADWAAFEAWRGAWRRPPGGEVVWGVRNWPLLGRQPVPECWLLDDAAGVAGVLGEAVRWQRAATRFAAWTQRWPPLAAALARQFDLLADCPDSEFSRLGATLAWLEANPCSRLFARQLPIAGLDSKWLESHTALLGEWLPAVTGSAGTAGFWQASGLRRDADRLRLRVLDPALRARLGRLGDIQAPLDELMQLTLAPRQVFIVENKQTGLGFDDLPGVVVLMARGYAVERLDALPWVRAADAVWYWGDIDTHGLAILGRLRGHLPQVRSVLMDEATLLAHRPLWGSEPQPHPAKAIEHLDAAEQTLYQGLRNDRWGVRVRLEQERIGWGVAWAQVRDAWRNGVLGAGGECGAP